MKKLFAGILTVALLMSLSVTAFAANTAGGSTEVSFNVDPTYTVTIPATVELNKETAQDGTVTYENDYTIIADAGVRLHKNENIVITVASDYVMTTDEGATLDYTITKDGAALVNDVVATFTTSTTEQVSTIHIAANDPDYAGEYKDTVTFTISVVAPTIINFTMDSSEVEEWIPGLTANLQAEAGMTWAEWIESDYNEDGYVMIEDWDGNYIICPEGGEWVAVRDTQIDGFDGIVLSTDEIIADRTYDFIQILG